MPSIPEEFRQILKAFSYSVEREAHIFRDYPSILRQQVRNRLHGRYSSRSFSDDSWRRIEQAAGQATIPWLKRLDSPGPEEISGFPLLAIFAGHETKVTALAFSPEGKKFASGDLDGTIRIWDSRYPSLELVKANVSGIPSAVRFSPDGQIVACGFRNGLLALIDAETGELQKRWRVGEEPVTSVAFSPDGRLLGIGGQLAAGIWDLASQQLRYEFQDEYGFSWKVGTLAFLPNGDTVLFNRTGLFESRSLEDGEPVVCTPPDELGFCRIKHGEETFSVDFFDLSRDGSRLVAAQEQTFSGLAIVVWDLPTGQVKAAISDVTHVTCVAFSPDGRLVASGSEATDDVRLWNAETGKLVALLNGHTDRVEAVSFSPDGEVLASAGGDRKVVLWDVPGAESQPVVSSVAPLVGPSAMATHDSTIGPEGDWFLVSLIPTSDREKEESGFVLAHGSTGAILRTFTGHTSLVTAIDVSADGRCVVSGSMDGSLRVWNIGTDGEQNAIRDAHPHGVMAVALSRDGHRIASGGADGAVRVWDARTGSLLADLPSHSKRVAVVAFAPDGSAVASGSKDGIVKVCDPERERETVSLSWGMEEPLALSFSNGGALLACGGLGRGEVRIWDVAMWREVHSPQRWYNGSNYLAFSPDDQWLAFGYNPLRLCNLETDSSQVVLFCDTDVKACRFRSDGRGLYLLRVRSTHVNTFELRNVAPEVPASKG